MKIVIDNNAKTIEVLEDVNVKELVDNLHNMIGDELDEWTIKKTHSVVERIVTSAPVTLPRGPYPKFNDITCLSSSLNQQQ